ncbi:MAG: HAD-IA family hydrolase [Rhizobacter sp.]
MPVAIQHLLFDADGVLQDASTHWQPALHSVLKLEDDAQAKSLVDDIFAAETEVLTRPTGFVEQLQDVLARWQRAGFLAETLEVLHAIEVHAEVMAVVQAVRQSGMPCHIGSNQQALRARRMSVDLNYQALFDREFYSCFIGAAKPHAAFFEQVVAQLGCAAHEVLFLDDRAENVAGAAGAGLNAIAFRATDGAASLRRQLAGFGVDIDH